MSRTSRTNAAPRLPNCFRTSADRLLKVASHPLVSDTIAAALIGGAAALAENKGTRDVAKAAGLGAAAAAVKASKGTNRLAVAVAVAVAELAIARLASASSGKAGKRKKSKA